MSGQRGAGAVAWVGIADCARFVQWRLAGRAPWAGGEARPPPTAAHTAGCVRPLREAMVARARHWSQSRRVGAFPATDRRGYRIGMNC